MSNLKVGDRVRILCDNISGFIDLAVLECYPKKEGIVMEIEEDIIIDYVRVRDENTNEWWWFYERDLELLDKQLKLFGDFTEIVDELEEL